MTWKIDTITLPFGGPSTIQRRVLRKQTANQILQDFPFPVDIGPQAFELQLKGLILNTDSKSLWESTKNAETESVAIEVTGEPEDFDEQYSGLYAVNRSSVGMSKPMFDSETGKIVQQYDITFIQFADDTATGDTSDIILDEPGSGFGDIPENFGEFLFDSFQLTFGEFFI